MKKVEYQDCLDVSVKDVSILDFMDIDEEEKQSILENIDVEWKKFWINMPEYVQEDNPPFRKLIISFRDEKDYNDFAVLIGQNLTEKTKSIWFPKLEKDDNSLKRWIECE